MALTRLVLFDAQNLYKSLLCWDELNMVFEKFAHDLVLFLGLLKAFQPKSLRQALQN